MRPDAVSYHVTRAQVCAHPALNTRRPSLHTYTFYRAFAACHKIVVFGQDKKVSKRLCDCRAPDLVFVRKHPPHHRPAEYYCKIFVVRVSLFNTFHQRRAYRRMHQHRALDRADNREIFRMYAYAFNDGVVYGAKRPYIVDDGSNGERYAALGHALSSDHLNYYLFVSGRVENAGQEKFGS